MVIAYMRLEKLRQVDLNLLIIFAVIAEEKSATKASARLLLSQPAERAASWAPAHATGGRYGLGYATLMVEILKDNGRPEAGEVYGAMDMPWAKLVGQIAQAYGK